MKLVYVTTMLPFGPGEGFLVPEAAELARRHELRIVPMYPRGEILHRDTLALRQHVVAQPLLSPAIVVAALTETLRAPARVLRLLFTLLQSRRRGILWKNLLILPKGLWLSRYARRLGAEHIHAHWSSTSATMAMIAAETAGVSWSFTAHRWDIAEDNLLRQKLRSACFARAISELGASALRAHAPARRARIAVIRTGVHLPADETVSNDISQERGGDLNLYVAANLVEVKGHIHLLQALAHLHRNGARLGLDILGDGPLREQLREAAAALGIGDRVIFHGAVSHDGVLHRLRAGAWDVCVLPSIVTASGEHEGIPVSLLEAMSAGVPVIATSTGAIPELLDGEAGVLVPPADAEALATALARLQAEPTLRERIGSKGRERVHQAFDVRRTTESLLGEIAKCEWRGG
jgi:colanic acid/amylovoran biosynthesis glycosyltransferase